MGKSDRTDIDRVWDVIDKAGVCMLTTHSAHGLRARPMEARPDRERRVIWFLTDRRGLKDDEIDVNREVCLSFVYLEEKVYLSITGRAFVASDPQRARALWNDEQQAWWRGPDDPNLLVIRVEPKQAEMWDGPATSAVAAFEFAKARLTGAKPNLGENRKITVDLG
jgi:general stress protein 26